ncbi:MAG: hypothetical protein JWQ98_393 [Chlorobi bacterium]|jgi:hypothetical protein|nr:hypothetical protein [Chlorobiota bacterium]
MTQQQIYDELKLIAEQLGLTVRVEIGDFGGDICTVHERRMILINRRHPLGKRINVMARSLHAAGLGDVFIKPALREIIEEELALHGGTEP